MQNCRRCQYDLPRCFRKRFLLFWDFLAFLHTFFNLPGVCALSLSNCVDVFRSSRTYVLTRNCSWWFQMRYWLIHTQNPISFVCSAMKIFDKEVFIWIFCIHFFIHFVRAAVGDTVLLHVKQFCCDGECTAITSDKTHTVLKALIIFLIISIREVTCVSIFFVCVRLTSRYIFKFKINSLVAAWEAIGTVPVLSIPVNRFFWKVIVVFVSLMTRFSRAFQNQF